MEIFSNNIALKIQNLVFEGDFFFFFHSFFFSLKRLHDEKKKKKVVWLLFWHHIWKYINEYYLLYVVNKIINNVCFALGIKTKTVNFPLVIFCLSIKIIKAILSILFHYYLMESFVLTNSSVIVKAILSIIFHHYLMESLNNHFLT